MADSPIRSYLSVLIAVLFVAGASVTGWLIWRQLTTQRTAEQVAMKDARTRTRNAAIAINDTLTNISTLADNFVRDNLSKGAIDDDSLRARLARFLEGNPRVFGVGVAYAPNAHPTKRLYAPYLVRADGTPRWRQIEDHYDYAAYSDSSRWYHDPMLHGEAMWNEPYYGEVAGTMLAEYAVPFRLARQDVSENPDGLLYVGYDADYLEEMVATLGPARTAYEFIVTRDGLYVSHPSDDIVRQKKTIFEFALQQGNLALNTMAVRATSSGATGDYVEYKDNVTGQSSLIFYEPIPTTGWALGTVFYRESFRENTETIRHRLIGIVLGIVSCCFLVCTFFLVRYFFDSRVAYWGTVVALSTSMICGIAGIWYVADRYAQQFNSQERKLNQASLEEFMDRYRAFSIASNEPSPVFVPTGVFIQSVDFSSGVSAEVSGYIWQKYADDLPGTLGRGFVFPEASDPEWLSVEEAYDRDEDGYSLLGWYFTASLRQEFDYTQYPLDHHEIWLRVWHKDFDKNVVLVPDLASYELTDPRTLPGVAENILLPGWHIERSYFDHRTHSYNSNFGIDDYVGMEGFPELYFSIDLSRKFLDPFISKIIPWGVVAAMLFSILFIGSKRGQGADWFGFSAMDVIIGCSALFFVLIFEHISLRESLASTHVIYFEYFYFALYVALVLVSVNSILFASGSKVWLIAFHDNLLPKLLFWPLCLGVLLLVSVVVFY